MFSIVQLTEQAKQNKTTKLLMGTGIQRANGDHSHVPLPFLEKS